MGVTQSTAGNHSQATMPTAAEPVGLHALAIYLSNHCPTCAYAYSVAEAIQRDFPAVHVRLINLNETAEAIPEAIFATPTYLLNGRIWSLGNPSPEKINATFRNLPPNIPRSGGMPNVV